MTARPPRRPGSATSRRHRPWRRWGPYVADRPWGTVREDYSADGNAWNYFPHDHARSRAYRWGEDGIAGFCDRYQLLCLGDGLLERPRPDPEGTATSASPVGGEPRRGREGVLLPRRRDADALVPVPALQVPAGRVPVPVAARREPRPARRTTPSSNCSTPASSTTTGTSTSSSSTRRPRPKTSAMRVTVWNRGPEPAEFHVLPHLWFRNRWSWDDGPTPAAADLARAERRLPGRGRGRLGTAEEPAFVRTGWASGTWYVPPGGRPLFTDNETNDERVFGTPVKSRSLFTRTRSTGTSSTTRPASTRRCTGPRRASTTGR